MIDVTFPDKLREPLEAWLAAQGHVLEDTGDGLAALPRPAQEPSTKPTHALAAVRKREELIELIAANLATHEWDAHGTCKTCGASVMEAYGAACPD